MCQICRRTVILFGVGILIIGNFYDIRNGRIPGVLQRFAVSYFVVAMIILFVPKVPNFLVAGDASATAPALAHGRTGSAHELEQAATLASLSKRWIFILSHLADVAPYILEWVAILIIMLIHTLLTFSMEVPGCPTGTTLFHSSSS